MRALVLTLVGCAHAANPFAVDPFIGTGGGDESTPISGGPGNTFPGAVVPWGMVSVSPHNDGHAPSGYRFGRPRIDGFGHVHLSGVGCPGLGHVVLTAGPSEYSHEQAHPGYYAVRLDRWGAVVEATATTRVGFTRWTFAGPPAPVHIRNGHDISPTEIEGSEAGGGFCDQSDRHTVYFVARLHLERAHQLLVKVGVSYVSLANARDNLEREIPNWDFDRVVRAAERRWTEELSRVTVEGGTPEQRTIFYTALYHMLLHPNRFDDANGDYAGMRHSGVRRGSHPRYSTYSLWDTYRGLHPFLALVYPERQLDMVRTMVDMYRESGWLPKWELAGDETHVMVGDPAAIVIADTFLRGLTDFDVATAWEAIRKQAMLGRGNDVRPGSASRLRLGYIADDGDEWVFGSVSTGLEYALADFAAARLAAALGHQGDARVLLDRSRGWRHTFDRALRLQRPRKRDGSWRSPFDPAATCCDKPWPESGGPGFVEGSAAQYTFFVPHEVEALKTLLGGDAMFAERLQSLFDERRFALGNEPDMADPYLFTWVAGQEWRTQRIVDELLGRFHDRPDGLPGNDDAGALSAWFVWSAIGLYPTCPGSNRYEVGNPIFNHMVLQIGGGRTFTIVVRGRGPYIRALRLDGRPVGFHLDHEAVRRGGTLVIERASAASSTASSD